MSNEQKPESPQNSRAGNVSTWNVLSSVFRAWFGVQTEENRKRDFGSNNPAPFIIAGVIFTLVMIIGVIIAVNIALSGSGH
jgi:uncharacterized membrane protein YesL